MKLKCKVCGKYPEKNLPPMRDFNLLAHGESFEWSDFSPKSALPPLDEPYWERSETIPEKNSRRIIKVCFPFDYEKNDEFWLLFQPAYSFFNGWDEYPDEIEKSAIVKCRFTEILKADEYSAWIEAEIADVIPLGEIEKRFDITEASEPYGILTAEKGATTWGVNYNNWLYEAVSIQGDYCEWAIYHTDEQGIRHLLLFGQSGFHEDFVFVGNITENST